MNKIKYIIIVVTFVSVIGYVVNYGSDDNEPKLNNFNQELTNETVEKMPKESRKKGRRKHKLPDYLVESELFELLKPPKDENLEYVWSEEYGCYGQREGSDDEACQYDFLNAKSLNEAIWMKNNGYPTKSMLDLVNDPDYMDKIKELARNKYPAALTVASIEAMKLGNYREAAHLALSTIAYSDKSKTYPHVLYGEALVLDDKKIAGVAQLFIAGLLGDPMANGRAIGLSPDVPYSTSALNSAHNYLRNVFGANIPKDPRPGFGSGDG